MVRKLPITQHLYDELISDNVVYVPAITDVFDCPRKTNIIEEWAVISFPIT